MKMVEGVQVGTILAHHLEIVVENRLASIIHKENAVYEIIICQILPLCCIIV